MFILLRFPYVKTAKMADETEEDADEAADGK